MCALGRSASWRICRFLTWGPWRSTRSCRDLLTLFGQVVCLATSERIEGFVVSRRECRNRSSSFGHRVADPGQNGHGVPCLVIGSR